MNIPKIGFIARLFSGKEKSADSAVWTTLYGGADGAEQNLLANNKEWVFVATDKVANSVAAIRYKVMRYRNSGDDQEVFQGPLVDFLEAPADDLSGKDFIYLDTVYKELTGNAFWEVLPGKKLRPLNPAHVKPIVTSGKLSGYEFWENGKRRILTLKQVLHDRYIDPRKPHWGVGKLEKIARWADTSSYANEFLRLFFINGASFGGFITTEEESEERIKLIKAGLQNEHVGVRNAHKMAVLPKGSSYEPVTKNMAEMQFSDLDDRYRDKILSGFGVPKTIVGLTTEVNRASAEASEYIFAKYTIKPAADDILQFLNTRIAPLFDQSGEYYFAYDEFIPANEEVKLKEREIALNKQPYKTVNEVRAEAGLPPVKGGDVVYGNPMMAPIGTPTASPEPAADDDDEDKAPKKALPRRARAALGTERMVDNIIRKAAEVIAAHHDPDAEAHKGFVGRVEAHEKILADKVRDFNNRQERAVMAEIGRITKAVAKGDLFDMDGEVAAFVDVAGPMLKGLMVEQAIAEFEAQGFAGQIDTSDARLSSIVDRAVKRLAKSYNNTTAKLLKKALNDGLQEGDSLGELTERVRSIYAYSNTVRAAAVARSESFYIANEASREAYRQSGVVKTMRWYTAEDELVCEFCGPEHGRIIGLNEVFYPKGEVITGRDGGKLTLDYRTLDVPPLHTNCRCFIRPEDISV